MKRLLLIAVVLFLINGFSFGQNIKKGNLIGTHVVTIELNPGVTMEKFLDFQLNNVTPEFEKHFPGWKFYLVKGIRGENKNSYGQIIVVESEKTRDKYYNEDGTFNEIGKAADEKMKPVLEESEKLGKLTRKYTDWIIL